MRNILLASATTALLAAPLPAVAQNADWTGPYFGGRLGYTSQPEDKNETILFDTNLDGSFDDTVFTSSGANAFSTGFCGGATATANTSNCTDRDGTEWAVHAGFDYQLGSALVAGVVGEYGRSTIEDSVTAFSTTPAFYTFTRRLRDHGSVRARLGFAVGNTLIYGTGGVAYGKIRNSFTTSNSVNSFSSAVNDDTWGYKAGGGVEQRVADNFSIGAQYLYTSLKDDGFDIRASGNNNVPVSNPFLQRNASGTDLRRSSDRFTSHNVSVVASFRF